MDCADLTDIIACFDVARLDIIEETFAALDSIYK